MVKDLTRLMVQLIFLFLGLSELRNMIRVYLQTRINETYVVIGVDPQDDHRKLVI